MSTLITQPTFNRLQIEEVQLKRSGLIEIANDRSLYLLARILAVGPMAGLRDDVRHHFFKCGEVVVVQKSSVATVSVAGNEVKVVNDDQIVCIVPHEGKVS